MQLVAVGVGNTIGNLVADSLTRLPKIAYENVGTDDSVTGGVVVGSTSGAGGGTLAPPVAGVVGVGQVGGSDDGTLSEIVVIADPEMKYMFGLMNDYQFGRYDRQYGNVSFKEGAQWALSLKAPAAPTAMRGGGFAFSNSDSDQTGPIGMGFDYFLGTGDSIRYFGPGSPFSNSFAEGDGAKAFTRFAIDKYKSGYKGDGFTLVDNYDYKFTAVRALTSTSLAEQYVGSWQDGNAYIVGNNIHFVVHNTSGTGSLLYGRPLNDAGLPSVPSFERSQSNIDTPLGSFQRPSPLGNIHMTIEWTVSLPRRP